MADQVAKRESPRTVYKRIADVMKKPFDFGTAGSNDLAADETIASAELVSVTPGNNTPPDLFVDGLAFSGQELQIRAAQGVAKTLYEIVVKITSSNGQSYEGKGRLYVSE